MMVRNARACSNLCLLPSIPEEEEMTEPTLYRGCLRPCYVSPGLSWEDLAFDRGSRRRALETAIRAPPEDYHLE